MIKHLFCGCRCLLRVLSYNFVDPAAHGLRSCIEELSFQVAKESSLRATRSGVSPTSGCVTGSGTAPTTWTRPTAVRGSNWWSGISTLCQFMVIVE